MKTEINNENKAKFFALYWGQDVVIDKNGDSWMVYWDLISDTTEILHIEDVILSLKTISKISDEDAIEVAKIFDPNKEEGEWDQILKYKSMFDDLIDPKNIAERLPFTSISNVFDYLRSRGYALPWMGLSVEEMVEAGWIKLV